MSISESLIWWRNLTIAEQYTEMKNLKEVKHKNKLSQKDILFLYEKREK